MNNNIWSHRKHSPFPKLPPLCDGPIRLPKIVVEPVPTMLISFAAEYVIDLGVRAVANHIHNR